MKSTLYAVGLVAALFGAFLALQGVRTVSIAYFDPLESDDEIDRLLLSSPGGATYEAVKTYYPTEAVFWRERAAELLKGEGSDHEKASAAIEVGAEIRRRRAPALAQAPDDLLVEVLGQQVGMIAQFRDTPDACNSMLINGPAALTHDERKQLIPHIAKARVVYQAMHAGETAPVDRSGSTKEDWTLLFSALANSGLSEDEIALVADPSPNDGRLCNAMLSFLETLSSADFPGADRLRAEMAVSMLGS